MSEIMDVREPCKKRTVSVTISLRIFNFTKFHFYFREWIVVVWLEPCRVKSGRLSTSGSFFRCPTELSRNILKIVFTNDNFLKYHHGLL